MDLATIIGLVGCAGAVFYGIVSGELGFAALGNFWDLASFLIVIIGCLMCMLTMSGSIGEFVNSQEKERNMQQSFATAQLLFIRNALNMHFQRE